MERLDTPQANEDRQDEEAFASEAEQPQETILAELWYFLWSSKKWWLLPILVVLAVFGLLALATGTGAAPFVYTFF